MLAARARHQQQVAAADAAPLAARSPAPGIPTLLTNQAHDALTADLRAAEAALDAAEAGSPKPRTTRPRRGCR